MSDLSITREGSLQVAGNDPVAKLRQVANQFEAVFVQKLFQSLNESEENDPPIIGSGHADSQFKQMLQTGLSEQIAGHLGVADAMVRELSRRQGIPAAPATSAVPAALVKPAVGGNPAVPVAPAATLSPVAPGTSAVPRIAGTPIIPHTTGRQP